ncbi:hypothetical protein [Georgenia sp. SUBG003]|uniref:hypothetical protein n=1 Tax=Georgenia sp. SUBG003 TaxID=1497974 RepID=UPI0004D72C5A|nr:hypothetical protein DA06_16260 [Georgenia sp. SUBG003]
MRPPAPAHVDWTLPDAPPHALFGAGARPEEKALVLGTAVVGTAVVLVHGHVSFGTWAVWQYVVAAVIAFDLLGGVVANGLNPAKRDHHAPRPHPDASFVGRLARRPTLFAAAHVQPIVVGLLFPGAGVWWGPAWYAAFLAAVAAVSRAPLHLQRPAALCVCVAAVLASVTVTAPAGFAWLPVVMALKLPLAHAVQEEPYRPLERP